MKKGSVLELPENLVYSIPGIVIDFEDGQKRLKTADALNALSWLERVQSDCPQNLITSMWYLKRFLTKHKQESYVVV